MIAPDWPPVFWRDGLWTGGRYPKSLYSRYVLQRFRQPSLIMFALLSEYHSFTSILSDLKHTADYPSSSHDRVQRLPSQSSTPRPTQTAIEL